DFRGREKGPDLAAPAASSDRRSARAHAPQQHTPCLKSPAFENRLIGFPKATVSSGREQSRTRSGCAGAENGRKKIRVILFACSTTGKSEREEASDDVHILRKKTLSLDECRSAFPYSHCRSCSPQTSLSRERKAERRPAGPRLRPRRSPLRSRGTAEDRK